MKKEKPWEKDQAYIDYAKSGASACVFIMRDVSKVGTKGFWIDISDIVQENRNLGPPVQIQKGLFQQAYYLDIISFKAELFPRITKPEYPHVEKGEEIDEETEKLIKYITWKTANDDIAFLKNKARYVGPKYEITVKTIPHQNEKEPLIVERNFKVTRVKKLNGELKHN